MNEVRGSSAGMEPRCPICGQTALLEFCDPSGVALCPHCGLLLRRFQGRLISLFGISDTIKLSMSFAKNLGADSLDMVELVQELEEEFGVRIPDGEAEHIETIEDAIRCIVKHQEEDSESVATDASRAFIDPHEQ